jgi:cysteine desulfurase/selenocysteine lyase
MSIPVAPEARPARPSVAAFDVQRVRDDFPILRQKVHGHPLAYFDNAATTQKPQQVLEALRRYYTTENANVHRGVHLLSQHATLAYEEARNKLQRFLNAAEPREIVFTRGTTEAINLVAQTYGRRFVGAGDEVLISHMEHHSNIVPWQLLCEATGAVLKVVPINDDGEFLLDEYEKLLSDRTRLVSVVHLSNSLGTVNPVRQIIELAHARGAVVLLDAAQSAPHLPLDVQELDCDFLALSGHKLYGPTGVGALYGKTTLLERMPPWQGGGDMIKNVTFAKTTYADPPSRFEAGTPNIAGAIGLGAALDYLQGIGLARAAAHEDQLLRHATEKLRRLPGVRLIGNAEHRAGLVSFVVESPPLAALDVGMRLDLEGVAVRTGHHCCQPVMDRFGVPATVRASFALYNTLAEVDQFAAALANILTDLAGRTPAVALPVEAAPAWPAAAADSPEEAADEIAGVFEFLEEWPDRYQEILDMGEKIPRLPTPLKTEANRVHGCMSVVHFVARKRPGTEDVIEFVGDSDAGIVRGLIALLERLFSGQKAERILAFDVRGFFARLGLDKNENLSMGRRNGLEAMVKRIRSFAAALTAAAPTE